MQDPQFVFIVGAPRSGTTWLHRMLAAHPAVAARPEELTVFTYLDHWERLFKAEKHHIDQGHWQQGAPLLYTEAEFYDGLRTLARDAYRRLQAGHPLATHVVDKHPNYARQLPLIHRLFPGAKVIQVIRDGREVAASMMSTKKRLGFGHDQVQGAARHWANNITLARRDGQALGPHHYLEVRYEQLRTHTDRHLKTVFDFCALPLADEQVQRIAEENRIENKPVSRGDASHDALRNVPDAIWKAKLSLEQRWTFDRIAGPLLHELGYAKPGWWAMAAGDKGRMAMRNVQRRLLNTLGSAKHAWNQPLAQPVPAVERPMDAPTVTT